MWLLHKNNKNGISAFKSSTLLELVEYSLQGDEKLTKLFNRPELQYKIKDIESNFRELKYKLHSPTGRLTISAILSSSTNTFRADLQSLAPAQSGHSELIMYFASSSFKAGDSVSR